MEIAVLGCRQTVLGFRLAGVKNTLIASQNRQELLEQFEELASRNETGLVIVDESCNEIKQWLAWFIETHRRPMVIEVPSYKRKGEIGLLKLITKRATGVK